MEVPVELVPLNCIRCGATLPAEIEEVAWVCDQCEQGQQLGEDGLIPLEIHYAQGIKPPKKGRPFWVAEGRVTLDRDAYGAFGKKTKDAKNFWEQPRKFIIPAFPYELEAFSRQGVQWLQQPPPLQPGPLVEFEPVTVAAGDVKAWAEFLVVALEAGRKDKVKTVHFKLKLEPPKLWILP